MTRYSKGDPDGPPFFCTGFSSIDDSSDKPMIHHDAAILHDLYAGLRQSLGGPVVADAKLKPDRSRRFRQNVFDVLIYIFAAPEDVDEVYRRRNVRQLPIDFLAENLRHLRVVDRHRDHLIAG